MADFNQLLKVLRREAPDRDVLYDLFLNDALYKSACGDKYDVSTGRAVMLTQIRGFNYYGYDYASVRGSEYWFHVKPQKHARTVSLNDAGIIGDRKSFDEYNFMDPHKCDYSLLKDIEPDLPKGMKLIPVAPGGVLENVIRLVGYDNLCFMLYDDRQLVCDLFEKIGEGLNGYYQNCCRHNAVGALMVNDDWGFNTQTMLSLSDMRGLVFPWHKKIVETIHGFGKPALLHSCGNYDSIVDDLFTLGYDARHSYEDNIEPVEKAYERFRGRIAVLGGIDMDFMARSTPGQIKERCKNMLKLGRKYGGYALGTGNSVPEYIPMENYLAMLDSTDIKR